MAYAGSPSDLTKQPGRAGSAKPLITAIAVLAIVVVAAMATAFVAGSNHVGGLSTADRSYDQIEAQRGTANFAVTADRSYDPIEAHRGAASLPAGQAGLSRAQIAAIQQAVGSAALSRAQIASLQHTAGMQSSVSRMTHRAVPQARLRRTPQ